MTQATAVRDPDLAASPQPIADRLARLVARAFPPRVPQIGGLA